MGAARFAFALAFTAFALTRAQPSASAGCVLPNGVCTSDTDCCFLIQGSIHSCKPNGDLLTCQPQRRRKSTRAIEFAAAGAATILVAVLGVVVTLYCLFCARIPRSDSARTKPVPPLWLLPRLRRFAPAPNPAAAPSSTGTAMEVFVHEQRAPGANARRTPAHEAAEAWLRASEARVQTFQIAAAAVRPGRVWAVEESVVGVQRAQRAAPRVGGLHDAWECAICMDGVSAALLPVCPLATSAGNAGRTGSHPEAADSTPPSRPAGLFSEGSPQEAAHALSVEARASPRCTAGGECLRRQQWRVALHCGHVFHEACLRDALVQRSTCPVCREVVAESGDIQPVELESP